MNQSTSSSAEQPSMSGAASRAPSSAEATGHASTNHASTGPAGAARPIDRLRAYVDARIIGQSMLTERLLIALLADGHLLVEGAPGLAKTRAIKVLADGVEGDFHRIQFTPDLLPADLTGTEIFRPQTGAFEFQRGPMFHNLLLADEVNRAPAKVQSALLEAMAERQVTIGGETYPLPKLFMVMATQNPIEQEGTYPLPEAQLDRFLLHVRIDYPAPADERRILELARNEASAELASPVHDRPAPIMTIHDVELARREVLAVHMTEPVEKYLLELIFATRKPATYGEDLARWIDFGVSPRATIALDRAARARAWLAGRDFVTPDDIQALAPDVMRHRIILNYEAEGDGVSTEVCINQILNRVKAP